jgi:hypothetical protein
MKFQWVYVHLACMLGPARRASAFVMASSGGDEQQLPLLSRDRAGECLRTDRPRRHHKTKNSISFMRFMQFHAFHADR